MLRVKGLGTLGAVAVRTTSTVGLESFQYYGPIFLIYLRYGIPQMYLKMMLVVIQASIVGPPLQKAEVACIASQNYHVAVSINLGGVLIVGLDGRRTLKKIEALEPYPDPKKVCKIMVQNF